MTSRYFIGELLTKRISSVDCTCNPNYVVQFTCNDGQKDDTSEFFCVSLPFGIVIVQRLYNSRYLPKIKDSYTFRNPNLNHLTPLNS